MDEFLYRQPVFSVEMFIRSLGGASGTAAYKRLRYLASVGRVVSLLRGVYAAVPPGVEAKTFLPDPFLVLATLRPDAVFCGHSALDLAGVSNQVWNHLTAYSRGKSATYTNRGTRYSTLRTPRWVTEDTTVVVDRHGTMIRVTGPELTLVEGLRSPSRVGGIEEFVNSVEGFETVDQAKLAKILQELGTRKLFATAGWLLERNKDRWGVAEKTLTELRQYRSSSPKYLEPGARGGVLDRAWNLIVPREVARGEMSGEF